MRLRQVVPLLAVLVFCGWPAGSQAASFAPAVHHRTTDSAQDILRFWTKQRMATAWPLAVPAGHPARQHASATGPSFKVEGQGGPQGNGWWNPNMGTWPMVGRLYMYDKRLGWWGYCSATVVGSANLSMIWTAGHCVKGRSWFAKMLFVPGQNSADGFQAAPYGRWPVADLWTSGAWSKSSSCETDCPWGSDYAAALAWPRSDGTRLATAVGSLGMWFGAGLTGANVLALGYPASPPYFDEYEGFLFYCYNPISFYEGDDHGKYQWHIPCDMTGGSSGGPWLAQSGGRWYVVSDTSNGDGDDEKIPTTFLDGPNLDGVDAKGFYDQAQGATTTGCVMPGVRGLRLAVARAAIANAHCSLGKVRRTRSVRRRWGRVLSQWPARGMQFATGARIDLLVGRR
jgi:hypothetical protein